MMKESTMKELEKEIQHESRKFGEFFQQIENVIVGQKDLIERILLGMLAGGHILIEGVPGLAKTLAVKTFAMAVQLQFSRIQFTPDMLPADLTGAPVYDQRTASFYVKKGPVFANIVLADEINRAPAKVQSALLEAMQERQVTIGDASYALTEPFLVLATQNMIEQDGTYPLPESQLDRFMLKVSMTYPTREEEALILQRMAFTDVKFDVNPVLDPEHILRLRTLVDRIHIEKKVQDYILDIVEATRQPDKFGMNDLVGLIKYGVSPRAGIHLSVASRAYALVQGRAYVRPQDIRAVARDVLSHRLIESYQARGLNITAENLVDRILDGVDMP